MTLTERDLFLIRATVFAVRIAWEDRLLDACWPPTKSGRKNGQRRLHQICDAGFWARHVVHAKPVRNVELLHAGEPGDPPPDCRALSSESKSAWKRLPVRRLVVYSATPRARNIFGGLARHRLHALAQLSHEIGASSLFFTLFRLDPVLASRWRSEDERLLPTGFGDAQPDAVLVDGQERPTTAVEFAADYDSNRFERLYASFAEQKLSYQIWRADT